MSESRPIHFAQFGTMPACFGQIGQSDPYKANEGREVGWTEDRKTITCPDCLLGMANENEPTYRLDTYPNGGKSITCLGCGRQSSHLKDVEQKYCAYCHVFHEDIWPPARYWFAHRKKSPPPEAA